MSPLHSVLRRLLVAPIPLVLAASAIAAGYHPGAEWCRLDDKRIAESSGLASSSRAPGVLFTHNDSGDSARFFAVNRRGATIASFKVPGAESIDWEDMARGPGPGGSCLYLGDIGDNAAKRASIQVYRVPEPTLHLAEREVQRDSEPAARFEYRYEDGPRDAEALMVAPKSGRVYVASKSIAGSVLYAGPENPSTTRPNLLTRVGALRIPIPEGARARDRVRMLLVTGGDISPDGRRLVVTTYADAFEWDLDGEVHASAFTATPRRIPLPPQPQREAICYASDGRALYVSTEGEKPAIFELRAR